MRQDRPQRTRKARDVGLFWLSVAGHLALGLALFGTLSGGGVRGAPDPFGEGEAMEVSLGGNEGAAAGRVSDAVDDAKVVEIEALAARLRNVAPEGLVLERSGERPRSSLSELFNTLGAGSGQGRRGEGETATGRSGVAAEADRAMASQRGDGGSASSAGDLWGQIEPCWRRLSPPAAAPTVTLELVLNGGGGLARPPRIVRAEAGAPPETQLLAEARALTAIQTCLPYKAAGLPGQVHRVRFEAAKPKRQPTDSPRRR
ncbi:hypothetical protein [Caulobacter mirabilis]|uniref:Uncharacterized protein n=1 Tax=Caulobacter mirabilis TaxID=69666 RepID=A0A2D2AZL7_9CAUL|nr:hypothetical protein [Caulobacter mirabilis]ATQ43431.1 hypothetical protein CSW64_13915 [Caulobacter mirabilis]